MKSDAFFTAIISGNVQTVQALHDQFKFVRNVSGFTGLMEAAAHATESHLRIVAMLKQEIKQKTDGGITALMVAAATNNVQALPLLQEEAGLKDERGLTAFAWAHYCGAVEAKQWILKSLYRSECVYEKGALAQPSKGIKKMMTTFKKMSITNISNVFQEETKLKQIQVVINDFPDYFDDGFYMNDLRVVEDIAQMDEKQFEEWTKADLQLRANLEGVSCPITNNKTIQQLLIKKYGDYVQQYF